MNNYILESIKFIMASFAMTRIKELLSMKHAQSEGKSHKAMSNWAFLGNMRNLYVISFFPST